MVKILIISHGSFAQGLVESIEMISGPQQDIKPFCLLKEMSPESFSEIVKNEIIHNEQLGDETLILIDLLGGTPFNSMIPLIKGHQSISFVCGVNLMMCLEVISHLKTKSLLELTEIAKSVGKNSIVSKDDLF